MSEYLDIPALYGSSVFSEKEMRGKVDMIAASLFLQSWLDKRAAGSVKGEANES